MATGSPYLVAGIRTCLLNVAIWKSSCLPDAIGSSPATVSPGPFIHLNYTTHVGIVQVGCDETACVKIYNPTIRLCWNWFLVGLRVLAARGQARLDPKRVDELEKSVEELLRDAPRLPIERAIERIFEDLAESAKKQHKEKSGN